MSYLTDLIQERRQVWTQMARMEQFYSDLQPLKLVQDQIGIITEELEEDFPHNIIGYEWVPVGTRTMYQRMYLIASYPDPENAHGPHIQFKDEGMFEQLIRDDTLMPIYEVEDIDSIEAKKNKERLHDQLEGLQKREKELKQAFMQDHAGIFHTSDMVLHQLGQYFTQQQGLSIGIRRAEHFQHFADIDDAMNQLKDRALEREAFEKYLHAKASMEDIYLLASVSQADDTHPLHAGRHAFAWEMARSWESHQQVQRVATKEIVDEEVDHSAPWAGLGAATGLWLIAAYVRSTHAGLDAVQTVLVAAWFAAVMGIETWSKNRIQTQEEGVRNRLLGGEEEQLRQDIHKLLPDVDTYRLPLASSFVPSKVGIQR